MGLSPANFRRNNGAQQAFRVKSTLVCKFVIIESVYATFLSSIWLRVIFARLGSWP